MAKIVWKSTPKAAYEWVEVEGGESMSHHQIAAFLDDYISENGLVPVETDYVGETPRHKYGRYIATGAAASAVAPTALPTRETDLAKANERADALEQEVARLKAQLDKKPAARTAKMVDKVEPGIGSAGRQSTEDARDTLNTQDGVDIVASGEEVREDMSSDDRSDDNPKVNKK
jgi:hypothetical protein